jgi:hypothetical protein
MALWTFDPIAAAIFPNLRETVATWPNAFAHSTDDFFTHNIAHGRISSEVMKGIPSG